MYHLIYISKANGQLTSSDIANTPMYVKSWDEKDQITGVLVYIQGEAGTYIEGRFMQLIEGPKDEVERLYKIIERDALHQQPTILKQGDCSERYYNNWEFRSEHIDLSAHPDLRMFFEMDENILKSPGFGNSDAAVKFLKAFQHA
ncbi:BLUF domain-containing protein [Mucilaginibacter sp. Bleaf8]|uniref:BLUF domain-containing protein n=1 Tax=Mucilaginibacter sp. Bleaf8 TaxID=2834430 RepID=UPI001BCF6BA5|nr:BLUF domain-containing protein [Mucilaginibacter sp. Bleaf8]MBS7566827.1 BLUF domain-containing protein [Mucilaginibacter sp. Bleaf8]